MTTSRLRPIVDRLKALAHPVRLRILAMLEEGELCVCEITAVVGLAPSTVSEHLSELRRSGIVLERKEGRWVHYSLCRDAEVRKLVRALLPQLDGDAQVAADRDRVALARAQGREALCRAQKIKGRRGIELSLKGAARTQVRRTAVKRA